MNESNVIHQHITPKFILNNFAIPNNKKPITYVYNKQLKEEHIDSTQKIFRRDYLYETLNENNEIDMVDNFNINEKSLANIEGNLWAPLCKKITDNPYTELEYYDMGHIYSLFTLQLLRTPDCINIIKKYINGFVKSNLQKNLKEYELDQWTKASIFPFHGLKPEASFSSYLLLEKLLKYRIVIYHININTTKSRFIINGEEPILIHKYELTTLSLDDYYFPIAPTVCLCLRDLSLLNNRFSYNTPMIFEASENFIKSINRTSFYLPGTLLASQISIKDNMNILI